MSATAGAITAALAAAAASTTDEDPGGAFRLLVACPSGLPPSRVFVEFGPSHDRIPHPDPNLEESIDEIWSRRIQENPSLYNGKKFRYGGHALHSVDGLNQEPSICLFLGLTDYRTFVGTNLNPFWKNFIFPSEAQVAFYILVATVVGSASSSTKNTCYFAAPGKPYLINVDDSIQCQYTSSPLGNGAIVETTDKRIIILQRSYNVGEFPGYFVFPGGHSEPQEIGISIHHTNCSVAESEILNCKVSKEMFDGITREVVEEIGVPAESLTDPVFIGISRRELNARPTAFFFLQCNLKSEDVYQLYCSAQDGYESTQLYTVSKDDLEKVALRMPGCHRGGHALYELMIKAAKDIQSMY